MPEMNGSDVCLTASDIDCWDISITPIGFSMSKVKLAVPPLIW